MNVQETSPPHVLKIHHRKQFRMCCTLKNIPGAFVTQKAGVLARLPMSRQGLAGLDKWQVGACVWRQLDFVPLRLIMSGDDDFWAAGVNGTKPNGAANYTLRTIYQNLHLRCATTLIVHAKLLLGLSL